VTPPKKRRLRMKFDRNKYLKEMTAMVDKAVQRLSTEKHDFEIYSLSIWTDPSAKMSSINFDSKKNSDQKVAKSNEWNKKYYDKHIAQGDLEQAKLFEPIKTRNCNPADFELRDFEELSNASIPDNWEERTKGRCWDLLEPALKEVGEYTFDKIRSQKIHVDFEMSVNGRQDWYEFTWTLR
jgi:hypothetical protein